MDDKDIQTEMEKARQQRLAVAKARYDREVEQINQEMDQLAESMLHPTWPREAHFIRSRWDNGKHILVITRLDGNKITCFADHFPPLQAALAEGKITSGLDAVIQGSRIFWPSINFFLDVETLAKPD